MAQVQEILGPEQQSGLTERELKDALWDAYFDVDEAVGVLMEEKTKRDAKEKKKAGEYFASGARRRGKEAGKERTSGHSGLGRAIRPPA